MEMKIREFHQARWNELIITEMSVLVRLVAARNLRRKRSEKIRWIPNEGFALV